MKKFLLTVLKTIVFIVGWAVSIAFIPDIPTNNPAVLRLWWEFTPLALVVVFTGFFVLIVEKRKVHIPIFANGMRNALIGILTGVVWLGNAVAVLMAIGVLRFETGNSIAYLWVWILASFLNVMMQELLIRGYLFQLYKKNYHTSVAVIATTLLFTAMHGGAFEAGILPVSNVITMSLFMSVLLEYTETLMAPVMAHFIWNTAGAVILGGVSLAEDYPSLLSFITAGNALLSGGSYKLEGSIVVFLVNVLLTIIFLRLLKKKADAVRSVI